MIFLANLVKFSKITSSRKTSLRELDYRINSIGDSVESVEYLMKGLEGNKTLITLLLINNCYINSSHFFDLLGRALSSCTTILNLDLSHNYVNHEICSLKEFSAGLTKCKNIQKLSFKSCNLGDEFWFENSMFLAEAVRSLKGLVKLYLSLNGLGENHKNLENIMNALTYCKNLSILNLSQNSLATSEKSFLAFLGAFEQIDNLKELDLKENSIGDSLNLLAKL